MSIRKYKGGSITNIIQRCKEMIVRLDASPWRDAMNLASDFYNDMLNDLDKYSPEVRQIINDSIKQWDGKAISNITRADIFIQTIRSISNLPKRNRS